MTIEIPNKLHNSIIGAKGRLIRAMMEECGGVIIRFPQEGTSDKVTIRGPKDDVEKARKQLLELATEKVSALEGFGLQYLYQIYEILNWAILSLAIGTVQSYSLSISTATKLLHKKFDTMGEFLKWSYITANLPSQRTLGLQS